MLDIEIEMILGQKRLMAIKTLLNELTFYTKEEVPNVAEHDDALCININGWCFYPTFQFDENFQILVCLQRRLEELRLGRSDIDILLWLLTRRTVLMVSAVAPTDLVSKALDSDDFEAYDRLVRAEEKQSVYLTARRVDILDTPDFDVFIEDTMNPDYRIIKEIEIKI